MKELSIYEDILIRYFKSVTRKTPNQHMINKRLHIAKDMMINTKTPLGVLAKNVGYDSFSGFFRIQKGISC
ncbi:helix-turn-helix transcriptional regulator [Bartonella sp. W8122]|uniref:helix-turn-helix domain-containing protein n=1 Tax=Bartonella TaxID=773 RepID=UPI0018DDC878|nr:helix-turn-helix transcriptional regulator [Bartonella sp. W8122]MBI0021414.1 helix-turn-helix transcriptional regulator [Bartonella apihabitans]